MSAVIEHCDTQCCTCPIGCMDTATEWTARAHPLPHPTRAPREPLPTMPFAPGVIDGPYTADAQAHHDWEDLERISSEGWEFASLWLKASIAFALAAAIAGYFCTDWTAVARLFSRLR